MLAGPPQNGKKSLVQSLEAEHGRPFIDESEPETNGVRKPLIWAGEPVATMSNYVAEEILECFHGGLADYDDTYEDRAIKFLGRYVPVRLLVLEWAHPAALLASTPSRIPFPAPT